MQGRKRQSLAGSLRSRTPRLITVLGGASRGCFLRVSCSFDPLISLHAGATVCWGFRGLAPPFSLPQKTLRVSPAPAAVCVPWPPGRPLLQDSHPGLSPGSLLWREQDQVQGCLVSGNPVGNKQTQVEKAEKKKSTNYLMLSWCPNILPRVN